MRYNEDYNDDDLDHPEEFEDIRSVKKTKEKRAIMTPLGGFGIVVGAVIIVASLIAQISVTRTSTEKSTLQKEYSLALEEQARLKLDYESKFDLTEIEREAKALLGMRVATELQVVYIGAEPSDRVMILKDGSSQGGLLGKISDILSRLSEYLS